MTAMTMEPIVGRRVLFPPGQVRITLTPEHLRAYLRLYGLSFPLSDVPALKDHDFDGRSITMTRPQLAALNGKFRELSVPSGQESPGAFGQQERQLAQTSKRMQFLS